MEVTFRVGWLVLLMPPDEAAVVLLELLLGFEAEAELVVPLI